MLRPMTQMTCSHNVVYVPAQEKLMTVISSATSSKPRWMRKLRGDRVWPEGGFAYSQADSPVRNTNTGAQRCADKPREEQIRRRSHRASSDR